MKSSKLRMPSQCHHHSKVVSRNGCWSQALTGPDDSPHTSLKVVHEGCKRLPGLLRVPSHVQKS